MNIFTITANAYLKTNIEAYYSMDYTGYGNSNNPDFLNSLKNTYGNNMYLLYEYEKLVHILTNDIPKVMEKSKNILSTICVVPRSKSEASYNQHQLLFKKATRSALVKIGNINDGTNYIYRHTNTRTTHLPRDMKNYCNDGENPYPGITKDTCDISPEVSGKEILLIDDVYTRTVNIDEDAIQALLDNGAKSVTFYAVAKTIK
jgi:hypothetical protein